MERVLPYDQGPAHLLQEKTWWCGPASTQVVLNSRGIFVSEEDAMEELEALENSPWDDPDGTDNIRQITTVLNRRLGAQYVTRSIPTGPPTSAQIEQLWTDVVGSIDAGFGVVGNIMVRVANYPRGTRGTASPTPNGSMIYHYLSIMGYVDDGPGGRHLWIADSGFPPYLGYWCSVEQMASCIAGRGYTANPVAVPSASARSITHAGLNKKYPSRSKYRRNDVPVDTLVVR